MPLFGTSELGGAMAAIPVTFGSGRQGRIPVMAIVDATGATTAGLPQGTNRSGAIAAGGTAQQLAPANPNRRKLEGQNLSAGDLWVNDLGMDAGPSSPSTRVQPGGSFEVGFANAVSIWGATTGQAFTAGEG